MTTRPIFDTILIFYLDAVSKSKFQEFYKQTLHILNQLSEENDQAHHIVFKLEKLHSLGTNSNANYPQLFSGVYAYEFERFFHKTREPEEVFTPNTSSSSSAPKELDKAFVLLREDNAREPWLQDLAEFLDYETIGTTTYCYLNCKSNCHEKFYSYENYEVGGFYQQYMVETGNRLPVKYNYPAATYCEATWRPKVKEKQCSTCKKNFNIFIPNRPTWSGNQPMMASVLNWWKVILKQTTNHSKKRFGTAIFEETHPREFFHEVDTVFSQFLSDLFFKDLSFYQLENTAMIIMSDHGIHFSPESRSPAGKVANKHPFGYVILPKEYVKKHPHEARNLMINANHRLVTSYDLRATIQYWMTGREWGIPTPKTTDIPLHHDHYPDHFHQKSRHHHYHRVLSEFTGPDHADSDHPTQRDKQLHARDGPDKLNPEHHHYENHEHQQHHAHHQTDHSKSDSFHPPNLNDEEKRINEMIRNKVFASHHGINIMTSSIPSNRTCVQAGIPRGFCGCNLFPCQGSTVKQVLTASNLGRKDVVDFMNKRISTPAPDTLHVCKPLELNEVILFYSEEDCLMKDDSIIINGYVTRLMRMISVKFIKIEKELISKENNKEWHLEDITMLSTYGNIWEECKKKLTNGQIQAIPQSSQQFCFCLNDHSWTSFITQEMSSLGI